MSSDKLYRCISCKVVMLTHEKYNINKENYCFGCWLATTETTKQGEKNNERLHNR
jgi:hypothetical protein